MKYHYIGIDLRQFTSMVVYGFFFILLLQIISIFLKERNEETSILVSVGQLKNLIFTCSMSISKNFPRDIHFEFSHNISDILVPLVGCIWVSVLFDTWNRNNSHQ